MYRLYHKVPNATYYIIEQMTPYITQEGFKLIKDEANLKNPIKFTQGLLDFKSEIDKVVE